MVQWLRLGALTAGARLPSLVSDLRCCKLRGMAKQTNKQPRKLGVILTVLHLKPPHPVQSLLDSASFTSCICGPPLFLLPLFLLLLRSHLSTALLSPWDASLSP